MLLALHVLPDIVVIITMIHTGATQLAADCAWQSLAVGSRFWGSRSAGSSAGPSPAYVPGTAWVDATAPAAQTEVSRCDDALCVGSDARRSALPAAGGSHAQQEIGLPRGATSPQRDPYHKVGRDARGGCPMTAVTGTLI